MGLDLIKREKRLLLQCFVLLEDVWKGAITNEDGLQILTHYLMDGSSEGGESIQSGLREDCLVRLNCRKLGEAIALREGMQIQGIAPNGNSSSWLWRGWCRYDAKGDIVHREVTDRVNLEPTPEAWHCGCVKICPVSGYVGREMKLINKVGTCSNGR